MGTTQLADIASREQIAHGEACLSGVPGCYCRVGFPYEEMCPACRDEPGRNRHSRCECPPDSDKLARMAEYIAAQDAKVVA